VRSRQMFFLRLTQTEIRVIFRELTTALTAKGLNILSSQAEITKKDGYYYA